MATHQGAEASSAVGNHAPGQEVLPNRPLCQCEDRIFKRDLPCHQVVNDAGCALIQNGENVNDGASSAVVENAPVVFLIIERAVNFPFVQAPSVTREFVIIEAVNVARSGFHGFLAFALGAVHGNQNFAPVPLDHGVAGNIVEVGDLTAGRILLGLQIPINRLMRLPTIEMLKQKAVE